MKLQIIHSDVNKDDLQLSIVVTEGVLDDLLSTGVTKIQSWLASRDAKFPPKVKAVVEKAKTIKNSLLDDEEEDVKTWWVELFNALGITKDSIDEAIIDELYDKVKADIEPRIDRSGENTEERLKEAEAEKADRKAKGGFGKRMVKHLVGNDDENKPRAKAKTGKRGRFGAPAEDDN